MLWRSRLGRGKDWEECGAIRSCGSRDWEEEKTGRQLHELISDVVSWLERRYDDMNYHPMQKMTGRGRFKAYLKRFTLSITSVCDYCKRQNDDVRRTPFETTNALDRVQ